MARGKIWHNANELRRVKNAAAGKSLRVRDGCGRKRGRDAWNRRRALARAKASLQRQLVARFGMRPWRRLRGKQARHTLENSPCSGRAFKVQRRLRGKQAVLGSDNRRAIAWPTHLADAGTPCTPCLASPTPLSEQEPLDDEMLSLIGEHINQAACQDHKRLSQQSFRFLALCAGARLG